MGDRTTVELKYEGHPSIYLYSHWGGSATHTKIAAGLLRGRGRWGDDSYLARVLFEDWVGAENLMGDITGFGLAPYPMENEHPQMTVDLTAKRVIIENHADMSFNEFLELATENPANDYDEFVHSISRQ